MQRSVSSGLKTTMPWRSVNQSNHLPGDINHIMMAGALEGSVGRRDHIAHDFYLRVDCSEVAAAVLSAGLNLDLNFFSSESG